MFRLAALLRSNLRVTDCSIRGPKKKKGEAQAKIESTDIINIFKDRKDPQLKRIQEYPIWVQEYVLSKQYSYHEWMTGTEMDIPRFMPNQSSYKSFLNGQKRQRFKSKNNWHHLYKNPSLWDDYKSDAISQAMYPDVFAKSDEQIEEEERLKKEELERQMQEEEDE